MSTPTGHSSRAPSDLQRFIDAQDAGGTYLTALDELRRGRKQSHWMWFVFPQLLGLGTSERARRYAIASLGEARAYLAHPVLGQRLRKATSILLDGPPRDAQAVFGKVDAVKLRSSMTLFNRASEDEELFGKVLERYFSGSEDPITARLLSTP